MVSPDQQDFAYDKGHVDPIVRKQNAKLTQVIQNFFVKVAQLVLVSRTQNEYQARKEQAVMFDEMEGTGGGVAAKTNKWFNLFTSSEDIPKEDLKLWRNCSDLSQISPMIIETFLDFGMLSTRQTLVLNDDNGNPWSVAKGGSKKQQVVLERWLIEFDDSSVSGSLIDELPLIYKQMIILIRSLYGFSRLLPAFYLKKDLNKLNVHDTSLRMGFKVLDGKQPISSKGRIGLSKPIILHRLLTKESHVTHKGFLPIKTTMGTLKVSVAYRDHTNFFISDNEEILSTHFMHLDSGKSGTESEAQLESGSKRRSISGHVRESQEGASLDLLHVSDKEAEKSLDRKGDNPHGAIRNSLSPSPSSSDMRAPSTSPPSKKPISIAQSGSLRPPINPFKIGSIGNSPPNFLAANPSNSYSLERRISITNNKSASNASLAAMLRNSRGSHSSNNTPSNLPIATNTSSNQYVLSVPRSMSSHGSVPHDHENVSQDYMASTPKFSSSFGSRASRRYSNASVTRVGTVGNVNEGNSILRGGSFLPNSETPVSGLYIDDDISDFVKMIDSKNDLRLSGYNSAGDSRAEKYSLSAQVDALNKFQSLKSQHQHLSDSVSASLVLHQNQAGGSRHSSRKSSHSIYSPVSSFRSGSADNSNSPGINSRLKDTNVDVNDRFSHMQLVHQPQQSTSASKIGDVPHNGYLKSDTSSRLVSSPVISTTPIHASTKRSHEVPSNSRMTTAASGGVNKKQIHYENVFDEDDNEEDFFNSKIEKSKKRSGSGKRSLGNRNSLDNDDDEDLLFTMSDMNLAKH